MSKPCLAVLQAQARDLWEAERAEEPSEEAEPRLEAERAGGRDGVHKEEVGGACQSVVVSFLSPVA